MKLARDLLEEFHQALAEGLPVEANELKRVERKLQMM
jgi:hypothetical protein